LRSIIVDDEPAARELLQELLANEPGVTVVGSYGDPRSAIEAILRDKPDMLFLDVQMPLLNGFELLDALGDSIPSAVVFVTAFDEHAIEAFDVSAADYVLKPLDEQRLHRAVTRAMTRVGEAPSETAASTRAAINAAPSSYARLIPIATKDRITLQRVDEIAWFEAQGKYIRVHTPTGHHLIRLTMQSIEARLNPERFVRVSRSAIVNLDQVKHVEVWSHGDYAVTLRSGVQIISTQGYRARLRKLFRLS
jgi:two-component system LytT family response regulator